MAGTEDTILNIIAAKAKVERSTLSRETELSTLNVDSLDIVEVFFELDEAFDISLPFNANEATSPDNAKFKTIGDVIDLVTEQIALQGGRQPA